MTSQQQKKIIQNQEEQGQQEDRQEEQWQIQRRKQPKIQEQVISKAVWRPVTPPMQGNNSSHQHEQGNTGISILPTQNIFTNLEVQEKQERQQAGQDGIKEAASQINQPNNKNLNDQPVKNNPNNHKPPHQQAAGSNKSKRTGIDLSLPIPKAPNFLNVDAGLTDEVVGGTDGECQEIATNMQEGDTKGGNLPHAMHEGLVTDPRTDLRASAMNSQQQREQTQQHVQNSGNRKQTAKEKIEEQVEKMKDKDQRKKSVSMGTESTPKSKNKPSKQKRDAAKRRQNKQQDKDFEQVQEVREELCNKFVMVDDNQGLNILPLQVQYMTPPSSEPPDKMQQKCRVNTEPIMDEYAVINSEDEIVGDNQSLEDSDDNDETSEAPIRAFSPHNDQTLENEIQQVTNSQCLSPRGLHYDRFQLRKQDANTVTAGRPNTRLFSSRSSQ
ncbi:transcription activator MSS11-like [Solanum lycopersicum]|uniref:transcription activator MSS11-like n=1 Tax=Solanum lycopersicum TaxID=4081 RepID=UPI00374A0A99